MSHHDDESLRDTLDRIDSSIWTGRRLYKKNQRLSIDRQTRYVAPNLNMEYGHLALGWLRPSATVRKMYTRGGHLKYLRDNCWGEIAASLWCKDFICVGTELQALTCQLAFDGQTYEPAHQSTIVGMVLNGWDYHPSYVANTPAMWSYNDSAMLPYAIASQLHQITMNSSDGPREYRHITPYSELIAVCIQTMFSIINGGTNAKPA